MNQFKSLGTIANYAQEHGMSDPEALVPFSIELTKMRREILPPEAHISATDPAVRILDKTVVPPPTEGAGHHETTTDGYSSARSSA